MNPSPATSHRPTRFFTEAEEDRICEHMNDDHADAVLRFARINGGYAEATSARMLGIDEIAMRLEVETADGRVELLVAFPEALTTPEEAHLVIVGMAKDARREETRLRAVATARSFEENLRTVMLATCSAEGAPDASVAPAVWDGEHFHLYISELSHHTANLQATGQASLMIIEDEAAAAQLLARRRLTFPCAASFVAYEEAGYAAPMAALKARFGKVMEHLETMNDFHLVRLAPGVGRLVNGFAQAYDVDPRDWSRLSPAQAKGHGHRAREADR
jgi:heme iron utilization protein